MFTRLFLAALAVDGPLVARRGSGIVNGQAATAARLIDDVAGIVLTLGSGFNPTGTRPLRARFANGLQLEAIVARN